MSDSRMIVKAYSIPIKSTLSETWNKVYGFKGSFWAAYTLGCIVCISLAILLYIIANIITKDLSTADDAIIPILNLIEIFLLQYGLVYFSLKRIFELPFYYKNIFYVFHPRVFWRLFVNFLIKLLIIFITALTYFIHPAVLIVTGLFAFYISIRLCLSLAFILERNTGPIEALKLSWIATRANFLKIIILIFLLINICLLGGLALLIGIIWTYPFTMLLYAMIYRKLLQNLAP